VPSGGFGPRLKATLAMLTSGLHLARRTACRAMHALLGTKVSLRMATKAEAEAAGALATPLAGTARNLLALEPALWRHLESEAVPPTNNAAERALRPAVLWRKRSFGTMSEGGARFAERMLTAAATLRTQGRDLLDLLAAALEGHAVTLHPQG
jgi:hypothetical protein